jgi:hypothetical protein
MEKIYCISAKGTVFQHPEVLDRYGINEVLCLIVVGGLYYCPELHVVFHRGKDGEYSWDKAIFPNYDENWKRIKQEPLWRTHICRIDAPKQEPVTDKDL